MISLKTIKGIGPASLKNLKEAGIVSVEDLLEYYPRNYEYRDSAVTLDQVYKSQNAPVYINTVCSVTGFSFFGYGRNKTLKIHISDKTADASLVCFGRNFLQNTLSTDKYFYICGLFSIKYSEIQSGNFDFEPYTENPRFFNKILPVYPLTGSITQGFLRNTVLNALNEYGKYSIDRLPEEITNKNMLLSRADSLQNIHYPSDRETLELAVKTLKYEELFVFQKIILEIRHQQKSKIRPSRIFSKTLQNKIIDSIPFKLTDDQIHVIDEIYNDSISDTPMNRILQGDVGCGKTLAGFLAAAPYLEAGFQAAFMAPTELLARQHLESASLIFRDTDIKTAFLTGKLSEKKKSLVISALENGEINLVIGTHALLSQPVKFLNLGFIIIDEQQKFGVEQRNNLLSKGDNIDTLMMTATPIPQTLQLSVLGDLSVSTIKTMPSGRLPVKTHTVFTENIEKVYSFIRKELEKGFQAYFVYPLIGESEKLNLKNAQDMFNHLEKDIFPEFSVGLIHSKISEEIKEKIMQDFTTGNIQILAATSVVEVGIDVRKATCMVIEHAERFGLSSLHQLRGRIGRSTFQSYTFLVFGENLTDDAKKRLRVIKENNDGFVIAEEDLKIRGPGDILSTGLRQSGFISFKLADPVSDYSLMAQARSDAESFYDFT